MHGGQPSIPAGAQKMTRQRPAATYSLKLRIDRDGH
jgi:hypothetical protein